jgi:predicted AAA+ superfamily ATPase
MVIKREIQTEFLGLLKQYPVVTVTGPRQSGKTTLVKTACPAKPYYSLEDPDVRETALADPRAFLSRHPEGMVLDEIQRAPELLSYLQGMADQAGKTGLFILTGSRQFEVLSRVTQSLAGRTAILKLLPLTLIEAEKFKRRLDADSWIQTGFYPGIHDRKLEPVKAYRNYFETYIERDLRQLIQVKDLRQFQKFIRLCAGRIGTILNLSALSNDTGVSVHTINAWLSILQASYIVFLLEPYFDNIGKRLIKSPKLYFCDCGLAAYLLGIEHKKQIATHPLRGPLFENLVLMEMVKSRYNRGLDHHLYFYRDSNGNEVDAVFRSGNTLVPAEIKSGQTFTTDFLKGLLYFRKVFRKRAGKGYLVFGGKGGRDIEGCTCLHFSDSRRVVES